MTDSPFADFANTLLRFEVTTGTLKPDSKGNLRPSKAVIEVTALLDQVSDRPGSTGIKAEELAGVDTSAVFLSGFAVEPMLLPPVLGFRSIAQCNWNGIQGRFILGLVVRSPYGDSEITGNSINGYFQPGAFVVEGEPWEPMPTPDPTPAPVADGKQYSPARQAAIALSALRVVARGADGRLIYADAGTVDHAFAVVGILPNAVAQDQLIQPLTDGLISDPSWAWQPGAPVFLGANGQLSQSAPIAGFLLQVATVIDQQTLDFEIQEPIIYGA